MNIYENLLENREFKELGRLLARLDLDNNKQKTVAVNHGKLSGLLDDDHTQYFLANGARELSGNLIPSLSDTYDIGSSTKLLRKGWLSELDTVLFAKNTVTLLGGWFLVSKDEGIIAADIEASYSIIEFDKAMTENDIVLLRAAGKVEYVKIGTNVFQYTYNVTRDLDGSGANDWAKGTPFVVLGQAGDGRIELNAYDTPRIQLLKQGSTYNVQTEIIRIGDLNGNWGYSSQKWGVAIGEYASNKPNILIDEDGNLKFRLYSTDVMAFANGNADISGKLRMPGTGSAITIGSTPPTASNAGTGIWLDRTGLYSLNANEYQVKIDATDGKLYAASGDVTLDKFGINLKILDGPGNQIRWLESSTGSKYMAFSGFFSGAKYSNPTLSIKSDRYYNTTWGWYDGRIELTTTDIAGLNHGITLFGENIYLLGKAFLNSDSYPLNTFVPLNSRLTSTSWDGDAYSTTAKTKIDLSAVFGLPAGIKAVYARIQANDSASANTSGLYVLLSPNDTSGHAPLVVRPSGLPNDYVVDQAGIVPCDANGDIYYQIAASGTGTMDVNIQIWGYFM